MQTSETPSAAPAPSLLARFSGSSAARDGLIVMAAQALAIVIALLVDVILFRSLPQVERGTLSAALALRNILLYVADVGLALTTVRVASEYFGRGDTASANAVFRRALSTRALLALLVLALAALLSPALARFPLAEPARYALVWAAAAGVFGMTLTSWGVDVSQSTRRFGLYCFHQVLEASMRAGAVALLCFVLLSAESVRADSVLWIMAAAAILAGGISVFVHRDVLSAAPQSPEIQEAIHEQLRTFGRYAGAVALLQTVSGFVEILLIQWQLGSNDTAVFDGARRLASVLPIAGGALTTVLLPRAAVLASPSECAAYAKKAFIAGSAMAAVFAGGLALSAGFVIPLLWGERYSASIPMLRWLCLAYAFTMIVNPLSLVFFPLKRLGLLVALNAMSLALSLGLGFHFISQEGIEGAAWSAVLSRGLALLLFLVAAIFVLRRNNA
ncbi:MAG TPA: oligosaccharide flippase family protein [Planctomycetota bacterium]|nr:oligosaccharide flippase family protein [Planctomycetota bacterium]